MLRPNTIAYLRDQSNAARRVLHPCRVLTVAGEACTACLTHQTLSVQAKQEFLLYYSQENRFYQQPVRVDALLESRPHKVIGFSTVGEPISAEARQCFRVSASASGIVATVGPDHNSPLVDVSASGFSVLCAGSHQIGQNVAVSFVHDGRKYSGLATVQSVNQSEPGRTRYGMFCGGGRHTSGDLAKGLAQLSASLQRAQLRRLAGG